MSAPDIGIIIKWKTRKRQFEVKWVEWIDWLSIETKRKYVNGEKTFQNRQKLLRKTAISKIFIVVSEMFNIFWYDVTTVGLQNFRFSSIVEYKGE